MNYNRMTQVEFKLSSERHFVLNEYSNRYRESIMEIKLKLIMAECTVSVQIGCRGPTFIKLDSTSHLYYMGCNQGCNTLSTLIHAMCILDFHNSTVLISQSF